MPGAQAGHQTLIFVLGLVRRVDQHQPALFRRRQQRGQRLVAVALVHENLPVARRAAAQLAVFLGMQFAANQPVARPQQGTDQHRGARIQPHLLHHPNVIRQRVRRVIQQPHDSARRLAGAHGLVAA